MSQRFTAIVFVTLVLFSFPTTLFADLCLKMSTTTSTDNSGLLSVLLPPFEEANGCKVGVIAVGTGKALKLGENGDVDLVFVHSRPAEDNFVAGGFGVYRQDVMHNDFVLVGPAEDPAGLGGAGDANGAFTLLAKGAARFVSRGDDSGTNKKELALWKAAGVVSDGERPDGEWYVESGQGMGQVLAIADEMRGYTLSDRGTFIAYGDKVELSVVFEGDPALFNPYGIIAVNPEKHPHVNNEMAKRLIDYITGPQGQKLIGEYRVKGRLLFYPDAIKPE